jgi:plastocyanin
MLSRLLAVVVAITAAAVVLVPVAAGHQAVAKTFTVTLQEISFDGHANARVAAKQGDALRFVWKTGMHNVVLTKHPTGAPKVNSGAPKTGHAPFTVHLSKKGTWSFICQPHQALGMTLTVKVS